MALHDQVKARVATDDFDGALELFQPLFAEAAALSQTEVLAGARARVEADRARRITDVTAELEVALGKDLDAAAKHLALLARLDPDPAHVRERAAKLEAARQAAMGTADLAQRKAQVTAELTRVEALVAQDQLAQARSALTLLAEPAKAAGLGDAHSLAAVRLARAIATRADALVAQAREALGADPAAAGPLLVRLRELAPEHAALAKLEATHAAALAFLATLATAQQQASELFADDRHSEALSRLHALRSAAVAAGAVSSLDRAIAAVVAARGERAAALAKDFEAALAKDPVGAIAALARLERLAPDYADLPVLRTRHGERLIVDLKKTLADLTLNGTKKDRYAEAVATLERMGDLARAAANADVAAQCEGKLKSLMMMRDVRTDDFVVEITDAVGAKKPDDAKRALAGLRAFYPGHPELARWREQIEAARFTPLALAKRAPDGLAVRGLGGKVGLVQGAIEVDAESAPVELEWRVAELATGRWALVIEVVARASGAIEVAGQGWTSHVWAASEGALPAKLELRRWTHLGGPAVVWIAVPPACSLVIKSAELRKLD